MSYQVEHSKRYRGFLDAGNAVTLSTSSGYINFADRRRHKLPCHGKWEMEDTSGRASKMTSLAILDRGKHVFFLQMNHLIFLADCWRFGRLSSPRTRFGDNDNFLHCSTLLNFPSLAPGISKWGNASHLKSAGSSVRIVYQEEFSSLLFYKIA